MPRTQMHEVTPLFPIPFMRAPRVFGASLVTGLVEHFSRGVTLANNSSPSLTHTALLQPRDSPLLIDAAMLITPLLAEFGALLFGERLGWSLKEMWVNVLETGGRQAMHNHANSFISGVVYLTPTHPDARTVFMKSPGGVDFAFKNDHAGVSTGPYNADKWISMPPEPGDIVLFPSYLLHAVPTNPGERRITMAFNAIPTQLDSWGYRIAFSD
jgi:Putative 2OG-Fe(II) oxygenase